MATIQNFKSETQLTTSAVNLISTSASETKFLGKVTVTNTSDSNVEVTIWRLATATSATTGSGGNWIWRETVPAGNTVTIDKIQGHALGPSMSIKGLAATGAVINFDASGVLET